MRDSDRPFDIGHNSPSWPWFGGHATDVVSHVEPGKTSGYATRLHWLVLRDETWWCLNFGLKADVGVTFCLFWWRQHIYIYILKLPSSSSSQLAVVLVLQSWTWNRSQVSPPVKLKEAKQVQSPASFQISTGEYFGILNLVDYSTQGLFTVWTVSGRFDPSSHRLFQGKESAWIVLVHPVLGQWTFRIARHTNKSPIVEMERFQMDVC